MFQIPADGRIFRERLLALGLHDSDRLVQKFSAASSAGMIARSASDSVDDSLRKRLAQEGLALQAELKRVQQAINRLDAEKERKTRLEGEKERTTLNKQGGSSQTVSDSQDSIKDAYYAYYSSSNEPFTNYMSGAPRGAYPTGYSDPNPIKTGPVQTNFDVVPSLSSLDTIVMDPNKPTDSSATAKNTSMGYEYYKLKQVDASPKSTKSGGIAQHNYIHAFDDEEMLTAQQANIIVVDTNQLLYHLDSLDQVAKLGRSCVVVPTKVVDELEWIAKHGGVDGLGARLQQPGKGRDEDSYQEGAAQHFSDSLAHHGGGAGQRDERLMKKARDATRYLGSSISTQKILMARREQTPVNPDGKQQAGMVGSAGSGATSSENRPQVFLQQSNQRAKIFPKEKGRRLNNDDEILACAAYFSQQSPGKNHQGSPCSVVLVTEDKVLRAKCVAHRIEVAQLGEVLTRDLDGASSLEMSRVITPELLAKRNEAYDSKVKGKGKKKPK